jgi:hypothetical protein
LAYVSRIIYNYNVSDPCDGLVANKRDHIKGNRIFSLKHFARLHVDIIKGHLDISKTMVI